MPGQYRSAQNVKPGWFIRHDDAWHKVNIFVHTEDVPSRRKRVHVAFGDGCGASYDFGDQVLTLTAREARAAGIGGDR